MRFVLDEHARLELPVINHTGKPLGGHVRLEMINESDAMVATAQADISIPVGNQTLELPWEKTKLPSDLPSHLYWCRLRYRLTPDIENGFSPLEGTIQLGRIMPNLLQLVVSGHKNVRRGSTLRLQVRVDDPRTGKGRAGVSVDAALNDGTHKLIGSPAKSVKTNSQGYATLELKIPADIAEDTPSVDVTASQNGWHETESIDLDLTTRPRLTLSTDKPIYQPGQALHLRALVQDQDSHSIPGRKLIFTIEDDDDNVEFQQAATTSTFGIAQTDWETPEKARLGPYTIKVRYEGDEDQWAKSVVRISRYELPQFTVHPEMDKPYYLPNQKPHVEVTANYLFGKPVIRGKVRVVRAKERTWNSQTQKWENDEEEVIGQGELDSSGKFAAALDLSADFNDLLDRDYRRIEDLRFAAYLTDLSTNRTEQKRFTVRITKEPIHIYVIDLRTQILGSLDLLVTTCYADGTPASVDLAISAIRPEHNEFPAVLSPADRLQLTRVHTNRYGLARLQTHAVPKEALLESNAERSDLMLLLEAGDSRGRKGIHREQIWLDKGQYLQIRPVKSLLRQDESIVAEIASSLPDERIFVDLMGPTGILASQQVVLRNGHAQIEFPYDPEFPNSLMLNAYSLRPAEKGSELTAYAQVLYPGPQELDLGLHLQKAVYRPGDPAQAQFRVRAPDGRPATSALGIVIYDKAVAERVRTDEEFGTYGFRYEDYRWESYRPIAGVTYQDLANRKLTAPVSPDLELLAEAILSTGGWWDWDRFFEFPRYYSREPAGIFAYTIAKTLSKPEEVLAAKYLYTSEFPKNQEQLQKILFEGGIDFSKLRDPWDLPYRARFLVSGPDDVVEFLSDGPDKIAGTSDDFVARRVARHYFTSTGQAINRASWDYFYRTGKYIRDYATLRQEMQAQNSHFDDLKDPWGHPYRFEFDIVRENYLIRVTSAGPDGVFNAKESPSIDDVPEWESTIRYFQREASAISTALRAHWDKTRHFPANEDEFRPVLEAAGLSPQALVDPWGHPYHFAFSQSSRYWDKASVGSYSINGQSQTTITAVTQHLGSIEIVSYGPKNNPADQSIKVASFNEVLSEQSSKDPGSKDLGHENLYVKQVSLQGVTGAISGMVTDPQGAVVANAHIKATNVDLETVYTTTSDESGLYQIRNIPAGTYRVECIAPGFQTAFLASIPVTSSNLTTVNIQLRVGAASETVEVSSGAPLLQTSLSQVSSTVVHSSGTVHAEQQAFTPRLRKYFPETLVWQPELVTDSAGRAQLKFLMADNITTWKMSVIGSTTDGRMGTAETELRTFQPFFLEHDPPKVLTQGDQIQLPVVLRNYLDKPQEVNVKLDTAPWFSVAGESQQQIKVPASQDAVASFLISADQSIHSGKQRVSAANRQTGDAVERTVSVHPDGEDITQTSIALLSGTRAGLDIEVPANAIPGSLGAELKIYPGLSSHVLDAVRGMVLQPGGCGEQITSLAYGSLLALQVLRKAGQDDPGRSGNPNSELAARARKYLNQGYDQLTGLQDGTGGFPYWSHGNPDIALTAYVLDFLQQASEFIVVNPNVIVHARQFLLKEQHPDGSWWHSYYGQPGNADSNLTALTVRALAATMKTEEARKEAGYAVDKAMKYLEDNISRWNDAYLVGQYASVAVATGRPAYIEKAKARLLELAHQERTGTYWSLEANTSPFYGWGRAGRTETTALAVQALSSLRQKNPDNPDAASLSRYVDQGLAFLLHDKDRYGIWHSTHATVNVLQAIIGVLPQVKSTSSPDTAEVLVNGQHVASLRLPAPDEVSGPLPVSLSTALRPGMNHIEIVRQKEGGLLEAQVVETHYMRWSDSQAGKNMSFKTGESRALRLGVSFDTTETKIGEPVRCAVEAERVGFSGYGMLLAEIGLPPGADVDRASLEQALNDRAVDQYDVLPDRVVFYLWPNAGGSKFTFVFRPRMGMKAASAPSTVYDYYNPDSRALVAPARFNIH
ncbi:MAG TPA: alpha-2-macroglobulin family protein [Candidatus Angelobacter sp.]|nr:alpha-2-macroglobulin family protein [Candidatus Angelobacter sp.]